MQTLRRIFFYIFAATYVVFCPLLILYALGYMYNPGPGDILAETGLIYISTTPKGASAYIDGREYQKLTPLAVEQLPPGEHELRITLQGHKNWRQTVPVRKEQATVLNNLILIPDKWEKDTILEGPIDKISPLRGTTYLLAYKGEKLKDITVIDLGAQTSYQLGGGKLTVAEETAAEEIISSRGSPYVLIRGKHQQNTRYLMKDLSSDSEAIDLTDLFERELEEVKWEKGEEKFLFTLEENNLTKIDIQKKAIYPAILKNIKGYGLHGGNIYAVTGNDAVIRTDSQGKGKEILLKSEEGQDLFDSLDSLEVLVYPGEIMFFIGGEGELLMNKLPYRIKDAGMKGVQYDQGTNKALVWGQYRIGVIDFSTEKTGDVSFEKGPQIKWIHKATDIKNAFWAHDASHVVFSGKKAAFLEGIEEYGKTETSKVTKVKRKSNIFYAEQTGALYFLSPGGQDLQRIQIIQTSSASPIKK